jgi:Helix-turn-helix family
LGEVVVMSFVDQRRGDRQARRLWQCLEHLHAVTYFDERCRQAVRSLGLRGFWMGYFGSRAAPLGPVGPGVVEALFSNFAPAMVKRSIPDAWSYAAPSSIVEIRGRAAAAALRNLVPGIEEIAPEANARLATCVDEAPASARPLFCANRDVEASDDAVARLWQLATALREHRGDAHVAVLAASGLTGCGPHLLLAAERGYPPRVLQDNRGWSNEEWDSAREALVERGLIGHEGALSHAGQSLRDEIEATTDRLAATAYDPLGEAGTEHLIDQLHGPAAAIATSGVLPYPNPIGLPPVR